MKVIRVDFSKRAKDLRGLKKDRKVDKKYVRTEERIAKLVQRR